MKLPYFCLLLFPPVICGGEESSTRANQIPSLSDYERQHEQLQALDAKGNKLLKRGISKETAKTVFGNPIDAVERSKRVEMWSYASSLSGTSEYWLVFLNGQLDFFGVAQTTWLHEKYLNK